MAAMTAPRPMVARLSPASALLAVAALLSALPGCKPKPGGSCKSEGAESCLDEKRALACHDGKWEEMPCRGAKGCLSASGVDQCDQSLAEANDTCNLTDDFVCASDKRTMLSCKKHRWTVAQSCLGAKGCSVAQRVVKCDNSVAAAGDTCSEEDDHACTPDSKAALVCRSGKFIESGPCKGALGCRVTGDKIECDDTAASLGDPCAPEGNLVCALDGTMILRCAKKAYVADEKCRSKRKCGVERGVIACY